MSHRHAGGAEKKYQFLHKTRFFAPHSSSILENSTNGVACLPTGKPPLRCCHSLVSYTHSHAVE